MSAGGKPWPPRGLCFAPRLGDYLARLEQEPLGSLFARPAALGRALRRASELLGLRVECLDVPAAWILHSAGWPATVGEHDVKLGPAPAELRAPMETAGNGPLLAVREALRALPPVSTSPATLIALPSPATLAQAAGEQLCSSGPHHGRDSGRIASPRRGEADAREGASVASGGGGGGAGPEVPEGGSAAGEGEADWARAVLQAFVRSVGEMNVLAGVMLDGDDAIPVLGRLLDHYQLTPVCIRRPADTRPHPPGVIVACALPIEVLTGPALATAWLASDTLVTTDGPVAALVTPEDLLRVSRAVAAWIRSP